LPRGARTSNDEPASLPADIPRPPTAGFVARRDREGRDILTLLKQELAPRRNKLATLSGAGGLGKTTIAAEAVRALGETYEGRLVWSDVLARAGYTLSTLLDDVATRLGRADLRALAPEAKSEAVRALLNERPALVALDNYETVDKDERGRIEGWLSHAPCSALITSRQPVKETLNVVIPTMLPDEAEKFLDARIAATQDSQLFSAGVRQRIYEEAEGNPYLMEWVVAQIDDAQEPETVLEELKHGEGDAAERVFGRSFNLPQVGEDGRAALLALSLFVPSASRPALAAVAGFGDDEKRLNAALKSLHALWLVKGLDENRRFAVEGLTRSLVSARLSKSGREDEFRQRFIAYFLQYAESHEQKTPEDYNALEAERNNLLSAMEAAFAREDWESVIRMAYPLDEMLTVRGYWNECLRVDEIALRAARLSQDESQVAALAHNAAVMYQSRGELEEARRLYGESMEIARRLGDQHGVASTLHQLAMLAEDQGEMEEARKLYDESLEIERRLGNQSGIASSLHQLGGLAQDEGNLDEARRLFNESLEIEKQLGNQSGIAISLSTLGGLEETEGNAHEAIRLLNEALGIYEKLRSPYADTVRQHLEELKDKT
jgi:tetratricopeptide (TPR) repeat protein